MVDLTSQKQEDRDEVTKSDDENNDISSEDNLETILLTGFAVIIMGILIFLFK
jgi:hypothetical protein